MRLTKFLGRKCKVCIRTLLLKSLFLGTNCPSFLPILCGFLFVFAVESFLFLPWNPFCFCRWFLLFLPLIPFVSAVDVFLYIPSFFLFFSFLPCSFNFLLRNPKNVVVFLEKVHRFSEKVYRFFENLHRFLFFSEMLRSYHAFKCACERKSMPSINPSAWFFSLLYLRKGRGLSMRNSWKRGKM